MSEITCDSYMAQLNNIVTACANNATTSTSLQTLLNDLVTIDTTLETEWTNQSNFPTTITHYRKQLLVEIEREQKITLQTNLYKFIDLRNLNIIADPATSLAYMNDTQAILTIINTAINGCPCMSSRIDIVKKIMKNN